MRALRKRFKEAANSVIAPGKTTVSAPACGSDLVVVVTTFVAAVHLAAALAAELEPVLEAEAALAAEAAAEAEALGQVVFLVVTTVPFEPVPEPTAAALELDELAPLALELDPLPLALEAPAADEPELAAAPPFGPTTATELEVELVLELELDEEANTGWATAIAEAAKSERIKYFTVFIFTPFIFLSFTRRADLRLNQSDGKCPKGGKALGKVRPRPREVSGRECPIQNWMGRHQRRLSFHPNCHRRCRRRSLG